MSATLCVTGVFAAHELFEPGVSLPHNLGARQDGDLVGPHVGEQPSEKGEVVLQMLAFVRDRIVHKPRCAVGLGAKRIDGSVNLEVAS